MRRILPIVVRKGAAVALPRLRAVRGRPARDVPLFVIGSGRSGNTLVRRVLLASEQIYVAPETYVLGDLIEGWPRSTLLPWRQRVWLFCAHFEKHEHFSTFGVADLTAFAEEAERLEPKTLRALIDAFFRHLARTAGAKASRWGDKTPWNTFHLPAIGQVFPDARYVWLVRDGRDAALSYVEAGLYPNFAAAANRWTTANRACARFARWAPHVLRVRYEDLVSEPERTFATLFDFAGLDFAPEMLTRDPGPMGDVEALAHHARVAKPISPQSVGRWRGQLSEEQLGRLPKRFTKELEALGYA